MIKYDWTLQELQNLHDVPLLELISKAHDVHKQHHRVGEVQVGHLISIKTGGCPEDCAYCAQSSRYRTPVAAIPLMDYDAVLEQAEHAIAQGASRICLGAAWRGVRDGKQFDAVLRMVQGIASLGVQVCCTLGLLQEHQAKRLKEAGLYAYNHNLDTSEDYYPSIISTRTYQDRLHTLDIVKKADLSVCCGGIFGMGESISDRLQLLKTLSSRMPHPDSVPINRLSQVPGTPLENLPQISIWDTCRLVAIARMIMPKTYVRLSCGRADMSYAEQALCFLAGANSIFIGEKLLTQENQTVDEDNTMFQLLGLRQTQVKK